MKETMVWLGALALMIAGYALFGVVFADLWRMSFASVGLPAISPLQAAVGWLTWGLLLKTQRSDKGAGYFATERALRIAVLLLTWGTAYFLAWVLS